MKATSSLTYTCVKQAVLLCGVALLKVRIYTALLASSLIQIWSLVSSSKDTSLTILVGHLSPLEGRISGESGILASRPTKDMKD